MRFATILLLLAAMAGCQSAYAPVESELGEEVEIGYGSYAVLPEEGITVNFDEVVDSRCPVNVQCVWAGNAEVSLRINREEVVLNTNSGMQRSAEVDGYTVRLSKVTPEPVHGSKEITEEYRIRIVVTLD